MSIFSSHSGEIEDAGYDFMENPEGWETWSPEQQRAYAQEIRTLYAEELAEIAEGAAGWQRRGDFTDAVNEGRDLAGQPMDAVARVWADATSMDP